MIDWIDVAYLAIGFFGGFMIREAISPWSWYQRYKFRKLIRPFTQDSEEAKRVERIVNRYR